MSGGAKHAAGVAGLSCFQDGSTIPSCRWTLPVTPVHRELLAQHKEHLLPFVEGGFAAEGTEGQGVARVSRCAGEHSSELLACGRCFSLLAPLFQGSMCCAVTRGLVRAGFVSQTSLLPLSRCKRSVFHLLSLASSRAARRPGGRRGGQVGEQRPWSGCLPQRTRPLHVSEVEHQPQVGPRQVQR